jgi:hypothetical protein
MLDDLIAAYGNRFLVAALGVSLALLCLFVVLWILRNRAPSPFVRGGRNRQPRLQVLDAAAVDTRRRIVLIRRDNVEHLVMIGGPTDIVIESGIGDERPYLSARPLTQQVEQDQSALPDPGAPANLAPAEPPNPMIAAPAAPAPAALAPIEPPVRRPVVAEPAKTEPSPPPARPAPIAATAAQRNPAQTVPVRPAEPAVEKPVAAAVSPIVAAAAAATPPTLPMSKPVEQEPALPTQAPAIEPVSRPAPMVDRPMATEAPAAQPTAHLEPAMSAEADMRPSTADFELIRPEPETFG